MTRRVTFTGPFFVKDPTKTFRQNVRVMMDGVAAEGESYAIELLRSGQGGRALMSTGGRVSDHVVGRTSSLGGRRWAVSAKIAPRPPASSAKAEMAALSGRKRGNRGVTVGIEERDHVFRRTAARLRKARAINVAELLKGIA